MDARMDGQINSSKSVGMDGACRDMQSIKEAKQRSGFKH